MRSAALQGTALCWKEVARLRAALSSGCGTKSCPVWLSCTCVCSSLVYPPRTSKDTQMEARKRGLFGTLTTGTCWKEIGVSLEPIATMILRAWRILTLDTSLLLINMDFTESVLHFNHKEILIAYCVMLL